MGYPPSVPHSRRHRCSQSGGNWAIGGASGYGTKKAIKAATQKKRVGKISAAQWAANKRRVQRMLRRTGAPPLASLRML